MFIELTNAMGGNFTAANNVLTQHRPLQIVEFLEAYWQAATPGLPVPPDPAIARAAPQLDPPAIVPPALSFIHHIVYALCLENTRLFDIMRRVVLEYRTSERLPPASNHTQRWLHATEELFFTSPLPFSVRSVTSSLRPDASAVRRNAYYRLLGMDLNHGTEDGRPYPYIKTETSNRDFSVVFEAFLREVWKGYINRSNWVSENRTDLNAIGELERRLREMLTARRANGNLAREEYDAVATLSWLFLTISHNTHIVNDLDAQATSVADRLRLIGDRVGLPAHARADSYFQLAAPMSVILRAIEAGAIGLTSDLYLGVWQPLMLQIITHWSIATGRDIKDPMSAVTPGTVLRVTAPGAIPVPLGRSVGGDSLVALPR